MLKGLFESLANYSRLAMLNHKLVPNNADVREENGPKH
jgi:hypothetical protein